MAQASPWHVRKFHSEGRCKSLLFSGLASLQKVEGRKAKWAPMILVWSTSAPNFLFYLHASALWPLEIVLTHTTYLEMH